MLRDIFGPLPFRMPASPDAARLTPAVFAVAQTAYDDRLLPAGALKPFRLGDLAAALKAAGCVDTVLLNHLRCPGTHVRGC